MSKHTLFKSFFSNEEVKFLMEESKSVIDWSDGRQGTGYKKVNIRHNSKLGDLQNRVLEKLGITRMFDFWDNYFLYYPSGSYIPNHLDEASLFGKQHVRFNVLIKSPESGGVLIVDGNPIHLDVGDAIFFYPDTQPHEVTVCNGDRLVFTIGAWVRRLRSMQICYNSATCQFHTVKSKA